MLIQLFILGWGENSIVQKCILGVDAQVEVQRRKVGIVGGQKGKI
jgi:hypothetical protein